MRSILCSAVCALTVLAGCGLPADSRSTLGDTHLGLVGSAKKRLTVCASGANAGRPVSFRNVQVDKDELILNVIYGGGCEKHYFELCWDETFLESNPVQADLRLLHDDGGDLCDAWLTEELRFDISAIKRSYEAGYRSSSGTVLLRLAQTIRGQYDF